MKAALRRLGFSLTRLPTKVPHRNSGKRPSHRLEEHHLIDALIADPLSESLHRKYADYALKHGNFHLAYAEFKTAEVLGAAPELIEQKITETRRTLPDNKRINHNQYFRLASLANEIISRAGGNKISVLDVGGGNGHLASFIPDTRYCLAEPKVNGISGIDLPFADHSFDYVVSCHVLEHIPVEDREIFLGQLLRKSRRGIILLNPFHVAGTYVKERLELVIKLTDAPWAKEHLECSLPELEQIEDYAKRHNLELSIKPNGTITTSLAFVFVDYFARKSGARQKWEELNLFFNEKYMDILDSASYPTSHIVYIGWPEQKGT